MPFKASAPGSMMLLGEYAVLQGKPALVCAVDKRMTVLLTPRDDQKIAIQSALGEHQTTLAQLEIVKPFQFVLGVLKQYRGKLKRGCDIEITAGFSDKIGLGSSAAVTVATLAAIVGWLNIKITPFDFLVQARNVVRHVQGVGSGADIAASLYGGMVAYQATPLMAEKFSVTYPISALYAGFKTPTPEAIKRVQTQFAERQHLLRHLYNTIGQCTLDGIQALRKNDWVKLGDIMNIQQGLMESLGVSTPLMRYLVEEMRYKPGMHGAKISGSGFGDCAIGLGELDLDYAVRSEWKEVQRIRVAMDLQGVECEKN